jgi:pimeloyl-ACP methyl ester carboxylesterase
MAAPVRERRHRIEGLEVPLLEAGADGDDAALFVHGNPGSSEDWRPLLGAVGEFARALAIDMPGFGRAAKPPEFDYTVEGYARFLGAAASALAIRRAHLVLHDFGGPFGLAWAASRPEAVGSIVLINTGILENYRWHYLARIWRTPVLGEVFQATATRPAFRFLLRHGNPRGLPRQFVDRMYDDYDRATRRAVLKLYRATDLASGSCRLRSALAGRDLPVLVVWGANDPYIPVAFAERQKRTFPGAEVVVLRDSGHWPFADDPDAVQGAVIPFFRRVMAAAQPPEC